VTGTAVVNGPGPAGLHCSLRAVTAACEALSSGQFDLVLAGGVAEGVDGWMHGHAAASATDDHVRVYDASPTGSLPGEGCGIVALTRAADAQVARVPAYAEIVGWHCADPAMAARPRPTRQGLEREAGLRWRRLLRGSDHRECIHP